MPFPSKSIDLRFKATLNKYPPPAMTTAAQPLRRHTVIQLAGFFPVLVVPLLLPIGRWMIDAGLPAWIGAWFPLAFLFVLLPALDYLIGVDTRNPDDDSADWLESRLSFRLLTWLCLPVYIALLLWSAAQWVQLDGMAARLGWLLSQGVIGGVLAINVAHELIHKRERIEQALGGILLACVGYCGFKVEHLRGHHVHVSTPEDSSSARFGQSLYHFLPRALWRNQRNAWRLEAERLQRLGLPALHWRNELVGWYGLWLLMALGFALWLGLPGLLFFLAQGLLAGITLEIINYVEHYGLERQALGNGRYERVTHHHSWNSGYWLTNRLLFQLQRHSDHHANARRRYQALRHHDDSPQLPGGYAAMLLLALVPPLWRRVIHPRIARWSLRAP